jgi:hypothetical protein
MYNPYASRILSYPLTNSELKIITDTWNFLDIFRQTSLTKNEYRKTIIQKIKKKYNLNDFFYYEKIIEKIYWNLFNVIVGKISMDEKINRQELNNDSEKDIKNKILQRSNIGESNVRKTYVLDRKKQKIFYKYKYPNDLDLLLFSIMINRSLYETIMSNINKITLDYLNELIEYPYDMDIEFDYAFPNFNTIKPFTYTDDERLNKIKKMYYSNDSEANWIN